MHPGISNIYVAQAVLMLNSIHEALCGAGLGPFHGTVNLAPTIQGMQLLRSVSRCARVANRSCRDADNHPTPTLLLVVLALLIVAMVLVTGQRENGGWIVRVPIFVDAVSAEMGFQRHANRVVVAAAASVTLLHCFEHGNKRRQPNPTCALQHAISRQRY